MIQEQEQLNELAEKLYVNECRRIIPMYPWVLVRLLPKEQAVTPGGIILPHTQNKIFYEGIVLETWKPFWKVIKVTNNGLYSDAEEVTRVRITSQLQRGDHVMFPHYEGIPDALRGLSGEDYRLVREVNPNDAKCEIMAKLEYDQESVRTRLMNLVVTDRCLVQDILNEFDVIPKDQTYKTISGK